MVREGGKWLWKRLTACFFIIHRQEGVFRILKDTVFSECVSHFILKDISQKTLMQHKYPHKRAQIKHKLLESNITCPKIILINLSTKFKQ